MFTQAMGCLMLTLLFAALTAGNPATLTTTLTPDCGGVIRAGQGLLRSPALPGLYTEYPNNVRCEWTLEAPRSRKVKIDFTVFDLQASDACGADYLEILLDGDASTSNAPTIFCGTTQPGSMVSVGHVMRLVFVTDGSVARQGFSLSYDTVPMDTPDPAVIIWVEKDATQDMAKLMRLPADPADYLTTKVFPSSLLTYEGANWTAIAADYHHRCVFWADPGGRRILRGEIDGPHLVAYTVHRGTSSAVNGVAADWLARTVYWTDATYNWIMVSNYNGSKHRTVVDEGLESPRGIAVHPKEGLLFWTDEGSEPKIERSGLDGRDRRVLIDSQAGYPLSLTIDYALDRIYWTAYGGSGSSSLFSASIHGDLIQEHYQNDIKQFFLNDLTIFKDYLFVTDSTNQLHCYQKDGTNVVYYFSLNLNTRRPFGLTTYAADQQELAPSGCDANRCEYLCVSDGSEKRSCLCQPGYQVHHDGSCHQDSDIAVQPPQLVLLFPDALCLYPDNAPDLGGGDDDVIGQCILHDLPDAAALTGDARDGVIFFSANEPGTIYSVRLRDGEKPAAVMGGTTGVHGMAVDWVSKHLYWTDSGLNYLAVSTYSGRHKRILVKTERTHPGSIALDPHERFVFWTYLADMTVIERAGLDGSFRTVIRRDVLQPGGITLDHHTRTIYFAERGSGTIQSMDYIGRNHRVLLRRSAATSTGLDIYKDYLLWTEGSPDDALNAFNLASETGEGGLRLALTLSPHPVNGIFMYAESRQPLGQNSCTSGRHRCQQLCLPLPLPYDFVCACAVGYTLQEDGASCASDVVNDNFLLLTDVHLHGIYQVDLSNPDPELQALPLVNLSDPVSVGYDTLQGMVYWSDVTEGTISRSPLSGGQQEVIESAVAGQVPHSIVVDSNSRLLYWTDTKANDIKVSRLNGAYRRTVVNTSSSPLALAILPNDGLLFWSWWGADGSGVDKAWMDGANVNTLVSGEGGFYKGLTADVVDRRLYWTDSQAKVIESMNFDTGNDRQTLTLGIQASPFGLEVIDPYIYWADRGSRSVMRADKRSGLGVMTVGELDLTAPADVYGRGSSPHIVNNACSLGNGGCGGLCLPTPTGRTCACAEGIRAEEDGACLHGGTSPYNEDELVFTSEPQEVTLVKGMEITQLCSSNQPEAKVVWEKDFAPLPFGLSRDRGIYVLTDGSLVILDVDETHRGFYTCTITGTSGKVIKSSADFSFDPEDIFEVTPQPAEISEGDDYILTCAPKAASHVIEWEKNGQPVQHTEMIRFISGDNLIIRQAVVSDSGKYTCVAMTLGGVRVAQVTALVTVTSRAAVEEVCGLVTAEEAVVNSADDDGDDEPERSFRIAKGRIAPRGSSPWIVRIWVKALRNHLCGGTLLNRYWVLTAAHCITKWSLTEDDFLVRLGDHDSDTMEGSEALVGVQHVKVHNAFSTRTYDSDIALVKLADPVTDFTDYVRPVCLPGRALAKELLRDRGAEGKTVGWGERYKDGASSRRLKEVKVPVVGQRVCEKSSSYDVTKNMFCAGYPEADRGDACGGDSGGPFSILHGGRWYQLGIVSWGEGCDEVNKYGIYTRLTKFITWVNDYIENH